MDQAGIVAQWRHTRLASSQAAGRRVDVLKVRRSKIRLRKSMRIYSKNKWAKFHPDPIWNDGALGFLPRDAL